MYLYTGLFKALGDATRLRIINLLSRGELCVCDLMETLSLPQSTISRHVSILKNAGWIEGQRAGVWMHYRLVDTNDFLTSLMSVLQEKFQKEPQLLQDIEKLDDYLKRKSEDACT